MEGLRELVARALAEDVGAGDITSEATVPATAAGAGDGSSRSSRGPCSASPRPGRRSSRPGSDEFEPLVGEGEWRERVPADVALVAGPARALLAGERTALNFLGHLSGIATLTARFVAAVDGTGATILDTRKTTPGLRGLEKAAVAAGGRANHRLGLDDAILIKENHIALAARPAPRRRRPRARRGPAPRIEVECRDPAEVAEALAAGADRLLLDNMDPAELRAAVAERDRAGGGASLEASGGITLDNVAEVAATGVEFISVGALTHSAPALDLRCCSSRRSLAAIGRPRPIKELRERREAIVVEHMESENRHEFDVTLETFDHPRYELIATGEVHDGRARGRRLLRGDPGRVSRPAQRADRDASRRRRGDRRGDALRHPPGVLPRPAADRARTSRCSSARCSSSRRTGWSASGSTSTRRRSCASSGSPTTRSPCGAGSRPCSTTR